MFFIYERKNLKLYRGSDTIHAIKVDGKYHNFGVEDLETLKALVEENCNDINKSVVKINQNHKIDEFYVDANNEVVAMDYKKDRVFDMRDKKAVNWVVRKFVEILENKKGDRMEHKYISEITILDGEVFIKYDEFPFSYILVVEIVNNKDTGGTILTKEELSGLINLVRSNCSLISEVGLSKEKYHVIKNLVVVKTSKGLSVRGVRVNNKDYICKNIAEVFINNLKAMKNADLSMNTREFDPRFENNAFIVNANDRFRSEMYGRYPVYTHPASMSYQPQIGTTTSQNFYITMGDLEITLRPRTYAPNQLVVERIKKGNEINVEGKLAPSKFLTIFEKYVENIRREEEEIDALVNFINSILPKDEKVELLLSTKNGLNAAIQYENNEGINNIKIKSYGIETVVYTRLVEPTVFKINSYYFKEKIIKELSKLVEKHNKEVENSKEF